MTRKQAGRPDLKKLDDAARDMWITSLIIISLFFLYVCFVLAQSGWPALPYLAGFVLVYLAVLLPTLRIIKGRPVSETLKRFLILVHIICIGGIGLIGWWLYNFVTSFTFF